MSEKVVIWSTKRQAWWRHEGRGYTSDLSEVGTFTREEAERLVAPPSPSVIVPISTVDDIASIDTGSLRADEVYEKLIGERAQ